MDDKKRTYDNIVAFYDYAEKLIDAVEANQDISPDKQIVAIEPLISQIEESTEVLVEIYLRFVESGKQPASYEKQRAEKAMRKLYTAIERCRQQAVQIVAVQ
jgi:hypothetical protein